MLEFLTGALEEAEEAARWYADHSEFAAAAFADELTSAVERIEHQPQTWPTYVHHTRRYLLKRFPYSVVYSVQRERVVIIAIAHASRRPGYWKDRKRRGPE